MEENISIKCKRGVLEYLLKIEIKEEKTKALMTMTEINGIK